jgi:Sap, sulfolipid-1-addressing protein
VLSLLAAIDPVRIGVTALLVSQPRPMLNLLAFWLGGIAAGVVAALAVLLFLRDFTLSVIRLVVSATSSPITAYVQVAIGVVAVSFATMLVARFWPSLAVRATDRGDQPRPFLHRTRRSYSRPSRQRENPLAPLALPDGVSMLSAREHDLTAALVSCRPSGWLLAAPQHRRPKRLERNNKVAW